MEMFSIVFMFIGFIYLIFKISKKTKYNREDTLDNISSVKSSTNCIDTGNEFVAIDFETTGLSTQYDRIVEVAAIKFSNGVITESFNTLVYPKRKIPIESTKIHGITDSMVKGKPTIYEILPSLLGFIGNYNIVAHNARFDMGFLQSACKRHFKNENYYIGNKVIDTLKLSRSMFPHLPNHKLGTVAHCIGINIDNQHRSSDDALAAAQIYIRYLDKKELEKQEKLSSIDEYEKKCFEIVKNILVSNNRSIEYLGFRKTGKYFDIVVFYNLLRVKLNGRKYYFISDLSIEELDQSYPGLNMEECPKSESGKTRILINSVDELYNFEKLIVLSFDKTMDSINYYRENVNSAEENIQEYLSTI